MIFSSLIFVIVFLPITLIFYNISKDKYKNYILLIASLLFYAYGEPIYVFLMLGSIVVNYSISIVIAKFQKINKSNRLIKLFLVIDIIFNLALLWYFKYLSTTIDFIDSILGRENATELNIILPIGISFFTFQCISYVVDVYRGTVAVQSDFIKLALYISFFPQLIAGPIVRYVEIEKQLDTNNRRTDWISLSNGMERFCIGFCKKVIIANNLSEIVSTVSNQIKWGGYGISTVSLWISSISFTLQIYYDFSGYSDMAIGLAKMFGFDLPENFNYPYIAKSATDFWRRWHISLSSWFRDYVYIPLGGNRVGKSRHIFNLFVVWLLTGIWHGATFNFWIWGIMWFCMLLCEKYIIKPDNRNKMIQICWQAITLLIINFGWVIFNSTSMKNAFSFIKGMLGANGNTISFDSYIVDALTNYGPFVIVGLFFAIPWKEIVKIKPDNKKMLMLIGCMKTMCVVICFIWGVSYLVLGANNPFLYFNF